MEHTNYNKNDPASIQNMFGSIAKHYDQMNAILSFQMHKRWNAELVRQIQSQSAGGLLLDLCCGTGEIGFTYLAHSQYKSKIYMLDFCNEMLQCAKEKGDRLKMPFQHEISYIQADAQAIPLASNSVDNTTIAYGIRNIKDPRICAQEVLRTLRPGGMFGILELTQPSNTLLRASHKIYLKTILPMLGKILTSNQEAYRYLCNSINAFIQPSELENILKQIGFEQTRCQPLMGGIATIILGKKPIIAH